MRAQHHGATSARASLLLRSGQKPPAKTRPAGFGSNPQHVEVAGPTPRPPGQTSHQITGRVFHSQTHGPAIPKAGDFLVEAVYLFVEAVLQLVVTLRDVESDVVHGFDCGRRSSARLARASAHAGALRVSRASVP